MQKIFITVLALMMAFLPSWAATPDLKLYTDIYATHGQTNAFTLTLGAAPGHSGYADVLCSGGNQSEAEIVTASYDSTTGALLATNISCQVDAQGIVEVYCDEGVIIDYICVTGADVTSIEVKNPSAIEILSLEHNMLQSMDLSAFTSLQALYLADNPFDKSPLIVGSGKPNLTVLDLSMVGNLSPDFDIRYYPALRSFDAMSTKSLKRLTPGGCPRLQKLSIDNTMVDELDITNNPELLILNISETRIPSIDLSRCTKLQQLYATHRSAMNTDIKLESIDLTHCPDLYYVFLTGNNLRTIDLSNNPKLQDLYVAYNHLTSLDLSNNNALINVYYQYNDMDFNTLPIPRDTWAGFDYRQRPLRVTPSQLVNTPLDLKAQVVREDSPTFITVFSTNENRPGIYTEVDSSLYTFDEGLLTFKSVLTDSVFASFYNPTFPDIELTTTQFKVKDASTFGKDDRQIVIASSVTGGTEIKMHVGMTGATSSSPKTFYVDLGDGVKQEFIATSSTTPDDANVIATKPKFGSITIYTPENESVSAFAMSDLKINTITLSECRQLQELSLINTQLTKIDLSWNRLLRRIELTGNNFASGLTLEGANGGYNKNILSDIILSNNELTEVKLNEPGSWRYIDLSHNHLTTHDFTDAEALEYLDVSHNDFQLLKINYCCSLDTLRCSYNQLDSIRMPEEFNLRYVDIAHNRFTLANIPWCESIKPESFIYAPQAVIEIPSKGPGYNLSSQYLVRDGASTVFTWKTTEGSTLKEGTDYTINRGVTHFDDSTIGKSLYCEMTHAAYPGFAGENVLRTTAMLSAGMPTHLLGTFVTPVGNDTIRLAITSKDESNALYIDWTGTETLDQYPMTTTYTVYNPVTTAGALVKVWSYDQDDRLSVFSISGTKLKDVDLSPMKNLSALSLNGADLEDFIFPESPRLMELSLDNNRFTEFDFNRFPHLMGVSFMGNKLTSVDLTPLTQLQTASFANNAISEIRLDNPQLWGLALTGNALTTVDLSGVPAMHQLFLDYNRLDNIDLSPLHSLRVVYLDHNCFDFSNLPVPNPQWTVYTYGGQPEITIESGSVIDLSRQAWRDGVATTYTWFYGYPTIDLSTGEISGEELFINDEYTIENGITTFHADIDRACCVMTNSLFPNMYLMTNAVAVKEFTGIESLEADSSTTTSPLQVRLNGLDIEVGGVQPGTLVRLFDLTGLTVDSALQTLTGTPVALKAPAPGAYIVVDGQRTTKVIVRGN